ncbi:TPA: UDP-N-acetylglucosamine 1-carboxyvinyltransferase [Candidatus Uhrbacteria bacterium]|nr:MAG: UDP-N-acetylglucosamine 1-carboxyvinyltransferase [Candidatus Uhrbacteria bacterium GW2011_GWF2_40_263]HBK34833.1 UDP-N-acetylglucosamine 1-carboxyvinyltransferase [Candidatus Uhrbacteria bacterium]HCB56219.1 UDP-N-acetylglucosamine 1-carboxyvinyltransferase [Candidatus Uhrbacteria bacterium]
MDSFRITGGVPLKGEVLLSGAKNTASKMMLASVLTREEVILSNVPRQQETEITQEIITAIGSQVLWTGEHQVSLCAKNVTAAEIKKFSRKNRLSILALPLLLHRIGEVFVPQVGGDKIGPRPVNFHLQTLEKMGAQIEENLEGFGAHIQGRLQGALIELPYPSVGATESAIFAGVLAEGRTVIRNAAIEPDIQHLVMMLQKMGAIIQINAGRTIEIIGVEALHGCQMEIIPDRMEAASYACMALGTKGEIFVRKAQHEHMVTFLNTVRRIGGDYEVQEDGILFCASGELHGIELETDTHPGFMTDWQQPFVVVLTQAKGTSIVHETVFQERFGYTQELKRMGADINLFSNCLGESPCRFRGQNYKHSAVITGPSKLHAEEVVVPDIRAGLALVVAALVAEGTSTLVGIEHLDRGYERLEEKLLGVGAQIKRMHVEDTSVM